MNHIKRISALIALMLLSQAVLAFSLDIGGSNPALISNFILENNAFVYLATFFGIGVLLAFTPCVLPMVPILSGIIVGQESLSTRKALKLSLGYVAGMAITYAAAGVLAGYMGSTIQTQMQRPGVIIAFSLLFVLMALSMFGLFELRLPAKMNAGLTGFKQKNAKHNVISAALMGILSTLIVSPCVTAPLIGVLTYIGQNGNAAIGGLILFVMALGMGLPLILVGAGYGSVLPKTGSWMLKIKQLFGFIMLAIAIWMLGRILPPMATHLLWAGLLILAGFFMGFLKAPTKPSDRLFQLIGLAGLIAGSLLIYQSFVLERPVQTANLIVGQAPFIEAKTLAAIHQELAKAKREHKPVFLEFSASWCSDCQEMDTKVFNQPDIAEGMKGLVAVRVEIGDKTEEVAAIRKYFAIYGTPTMLFFDAKGEPLKQLTSAGLVIDKSALLNLFKAAKAA